VMALRDVDEGAETRWRWRFDVELNINFVLAGQVDMMGVKIVVAAGALCL